MYERKSLFVLSQSDFSTTVILKFREEKISGTCELKRYAMNEDYF
jgi:hypothetical protein